MWKQTLSPGATHSVGQHQSWEENHRNPVSRPSVLILPRQAPSTQVFETTVETPVPSAAASAPRQLVNIPQEPNLLLFPSWQSTITAADCPSIHYSCGTTSSRLPKKPARKCSGGPSHTPQPKPFLPNRWQSSFCPLLSPKAFIITVGQCVICVF